MIFSPHSRRPLLWFPCALGLLIGCDPSALQGLRPKTGEQKKPAKKAAAPDPDFSCKQFFWARSYSLVSHLRTGPASSFARLTNPQKEALARLIRRSEIRHKLSVADGRILITMPRTLSPPRTRPLELLLAEDLGRLVIFDPQRKLRFALPLDRLPDVLDGVMRSRRGDFRLDLAVAAGTEARALPVPSGIKASTFAARVSLNYFSDRKTHKPQRIEQQLEVALPDSPARLPFYSPTLLVALPLLQAPSGLPALESLTFALGRPPLSWALTTKNHSRASHAASTIITRVFDQGHVRVPRCEFAEDRKDYRDARTLLRPQGKGLQRFLPTELARLREARAGGAMAVHNRSRFVAHVHVDGALLGWVAPGSAMDFNGLPAGFYRVQARSPLGIRTWGPVDMYVPGPLTLD